MELYYFEPSPPCRAVLLFLHELNIKPTMKKINLLKGENLTADFKSVMLKYLSFGSCSNTRQRSVPFYSILLSFSVESATNDTVAYRRRFRSLRKSCHPHLPGGTIRSEFKLLPERSEDSGSDKSAIDV